MKKILFIIFVLSNIAYADRSELYFGVDLFKGYNTYTYDWNTQPNSDLDNDSKGLRLKFGAALEDAWKVQGYLSGEDFKNSNFSLFGSDGNLYELGVDVVKGFSHQNSLTPFILAGASTGSMEVNGYSDDTISSFALKVGVGISYHFTSEIEGIVGIDFKYRTWQKIDGYNGLTYIELETRERIFSPYLGLNYHF